MGSGDGIAKKGGGHDGLAIGVALHEHEAAHGLCVHVRALVGRIGAGTAEWRDRAEDQAGILGAQALEIEADLVQVAGRVRFQNDICGARKATDGVTPRVGCNVRDGAALVGVE